MKKEIQKIFQFQVSERLQASCFILMHAGYWAVLALGLFKDTLTYSNTRLQVFQFPGQTRAAKTRTVSFQKYVFPHSHKSSVSIYNLTLIEGQ